MAQVYKAYFTESLNIGDHETLAKLADEIGLNATEVIDLFPAINTRIQ